MTVPELPRIWCWQCGRVSTHLPVAKRLLHGWSFSAEGHDLCPRCTK